MILKINMYSCQNSFSPIAEENSSQNHLNPEGQRVIKSFFNPEQKQTQYFFSPRASPSGIKTIGLKSPSPFKKSSLVNELEEIDFDQYPGQVLSPEQKDKYISQIIDFHETPHPKRKVREVETSIRTPKSPYSGKKETKGLRTLSESVYQIVLEEKVTTYKEVASRLVERLYSYENVQLQAQERDQQNIKRRVYDALNVLISAKVLKKRGKKVIANDKAIPEKMRQFENTVKKEAYQKLREDLEDRQFQVKKKRQKLIELSQRKKILEIILKRNMKKRYKKQKKMQFPLIGLTDQSGSPLYQSMNNDSLIFIKVRNLEQLLGDSDLLMGVDITSHNVDEIMDVEVNDEESHYPELPSTILPNN